MDRSNSEYKNNTFLCIRLLHPGNPCGLCRNPGRKKANENGGAGTL